jgi:hypothetical protein
MPLSEFLATRRLRVAASVVATTLASCAVLVVIDSPAAPRW